MDILYLLIPLSVVLVLMILAGLWWAIDRGQETGSFPEGLASPNSVSAIAGPPSVPGSQAISTACARSSAAGMKSFP